MLTASHCPPVLRGGGPRRQARTQPFRAPRTTIRAVPGKGDGLEDYVEVKVDSVRVSQGSAVVYLKLLDATGYTLPVHIGEAESNALLREINRQRASRPLTHDVAKSMVAAVGFRVTKIRVTDIIANTYYARIHLGRAPPPGAPAGAAAEEVDVDARPSDAINLAIRFGAPMYVARRIADAAAGPPVEQFGPGAAAAAAAALSGGESNAEIVRSVREALSQFDDPTVMYQLQKELAIKEERFEDARTFHEHIVHEMTHNGLLRMVVAMETALADGRYEEAAKLRDEYRRAQAGGAPPVPQPRNAAGGGGGGAGGGAGA